MSVQFTPDEMMAYLEEVFPQVRSEFQIEELTATTTVIRLKVAERHLRPGGTVSGPAMFSLADVAAYVMTMARIGRQALTVTTSATLDFMRKPAAGTDLVAHARLLKIGRSLSVTDMLIYSEGMADPVARASMTYAIPPRQG